MGLAQLLFLKTWTDENIVSKPRSEASPLPPGRLTQMCLDEAGRSGFRLPELEQEVGDLNVFIEETVRRKKAKPRRPHRPKAGKPARFE